MEEHKASYNIIGLMSGTSLDGLDLVAATFRRDDHGWRYEVVASKTHSYDDQWKQLLRDVHHFDLEKAMELHMAYGKYLGEVASEFILEHHLSGLIDAIASHGHTVLHAPDKGYTFQLGHGASIAAASRLRVVSDLRSMDVALGGQGAPIVPIGERYLFPGYRTFINIGGITNISFHKKDVVQAYDICPGNTPLNLLALLMGTAYDKDGEMARSGQIVPELVGKLEAFSFYDRDIPRSLHTYQIVQEFMPVIDMAPGSVQDKLHTVTEHIASQIAGHLEMYIPESYRKEPVLVTGGGALNHYLIERLLALAQFEIAIPDREVVEYKEALIMAFIALLRLEGEVNCLRSVTGASRDSVGGALHSPVN